MRHPSAFAARLRAPGGARPAREVLSELRRAVLSGDAPPGTAIPLREVAEAFGVSAIPVREALQVLVGEGLVVHRAHAGYAVARLSRGELAELYVVRGALEEAALRAAAPRAGDDDVDVARAALDALTACLADGDARSYHELSRAFHVALMAPSGMPRLLGMVESAWNLTEPAQPMRHSTWREREHLHDQHVGMLEAFARRDAPALLAAAAAHQHRLEDVVARVPLGDARGAGEIYDEGNGTATRRA